MLNRKYVKLLLLVCLMTVDLFAVEGKIRVFIKSKDAIYTSQKVTVAVELLSSAFSITDARIHFPPSDTYIVQAPKSASYLGKEEVDGEAWTMVHYEYEVYALRVGKIVIPSVAVSFMASMGYGQPKKEFDLKSDALHVDVKVPEGIRNNQFVLVTDNYTLYLKQEPKKEKLIVGDAVMLSVTQKAQGIPDILLRPVSYESNAFLRVYEKEPELKSDLKGSYDVSRIDSFTFIASSEGNVTLPEQERVWWNSQTHKAQIETIPALSFEIIPYPQIEIDAKKAEQKQRLWYIVAMSFLLILLYLLLGKKIRVYLQERKRMYALSEAGKFSELLSALKIDDVSSIYRHLYIWLLSIAPELSRGGFSMIIEMQPSFKESLHELEEKILDNKQRLDIIAFTEELHKLRKMLLKRKIKQADGLPQTINPN